MPQTKAILIAEIKFNDRTFKNEGINFGCFGRACKYICG